MNRFSRLRPGLGRLTGPTRDCVCGRGVDRGAVSDPGVLWCHPETTERGRGRSLPAHAARPPFTTRRSEGGEPDVWCQSAHVGAVRRSGCQGDASPRGAVSRRAKGYRCPGDFAGQGWDGAASLSESGAGNPGFAHQAPLPIDPGMGPLLPCHAVVREDEDGAVTVSFMDPLAILRMVDRPEVPVIAAAVRGPLERAGVAMASCSRRTKWRFGGAEGDRTPDLRIANATLSQLSYGPTRATILAEKKNIDTPAFDLVSH